MSARKVQKEQISENLLQLKIGEPVEVIIGDSIYEMTQLSHEDFSVFERLIFEAVETIAKTVSEIKEGVEDGEEKVAVRNSILQSIDMIRDTDLFSIIKEFTLKEFDPEDVAKATMPQVVYACSVWLELNLFTIPEEVWGRILRVMSS